MTPERYSKVCELFDQAHELPAGERTSFLEAACGGDTSLLGQVQEMLADDCTADAATLSPAPDLRLTELLPLIGGVELPAGRRVGPYEIQRQLGSGGMGAVYLAHRVDDYRQEVALKVIKSGLGAGEMLARFRTERQVLAGLNHPNIARLLDGGTTDEGMPYFVMEYVDGKRIDRYCDDRGLHVSERARLLRTLAEAVQYAHERTVIHRDLKPSNVLMTADGVPKIVDFGLAKRIVTSTDATRDGETQSGAILGTPGYMAPEQAGGRVKELGPAVDVYALGAVFYELLVGRPPFRGDTPLDALMQVLMEDPVPPGALHPKLPRDLETICLKCLEKDPRQRYASARELAEDLARFLNGEPILARPISRMERLWRWCRRHPGVAGLTAVVALLLFIVTVSALFLARHEKGLRLETEQALHDLGITVAERELHNRDDVGLAESFLEQCPPARRTWEWHYLHRQLDGDPPVLRGHDKGVWCVAFSPDNRLIASASIDETVRLWDVRTGNLVRIFDGHRKEGDLIRALRPDEVIPVMCVAFSPDGKLIASGSFRAVKVWEADTGKELRTYRAQGHLMLSLAFSPDGKTICSANWDRSVHLWDVETRETRHALTGHTDWTNRPAFSPDGLVVATPSMDGTTKLWDTRTGAEVATLVGHDGPVRDAEFSRDGRWLATAGMDGPVLIWDVKSHKIAQRLAGHSGGTLGLCFHPDGHRLGSTGFDRKVKVWDTSTGKDVITLRGHTDTCWSIAFSPDGHRLASASFDGTVRLWDGTPKDATSPAFARGGEFLLLQGHEERVNQLAFSPDGSKLATSSWDRTARIWDAITGRPLAQLTGHEGMVWGIAFSPDGTRVATASWDRTARLWEAETGRLLRTLRGHATLVHSVAFSPDGTRVATSSVDGKVKLWGASTGAEVFTFLAHNPLAYSVVFSPDGTQLITGGGDRLVRIRDLKTGGEVRVLRGHESVVHAVAVSPDGATLASASWDKTVKVWSTATGELLHTLVHEDRVHTVAFTHDGRLVTGGEAKSVRIWDVQTGSALGQPLIHRGSVWGVAVSRDGRLASASWYLPAGVRLWAKLPDREPAKE